MSNFSRVAMAATLSVATLLSVSLAPAQADELSPSPVTQLAVTDAPVPEDVNAPTAPVEEAQDEPDAGASDPESPQDSPTASPNGPSSNEDRAAAAYSTEILTPADGASIPDGSVAYTVTVATVGDYWLDLYCAGDFRDDVYLTASSDGQQFSGALGAVDQGESCYLSLYPVSGGTGEDSSSFTVSLNLEVRKATAKPGEFYPRVRDGFRDSTSIGFQSRLDSDVSVKIVSRTTGSVLRAFALSGRESRNYYQRRGVVWNGKNKAGNLVPTGRYTAVITSTLNGQSATARVAIKVASGHRTVRKTVSKNGWYGSRDKTRGNCFTSESYDGGNDLDCWGGVYAQATYRFSLPRDARNVDWAVRGRNECCNVGRVTKTGKRTSATSFLVTVRVTNWRSFVVRRARVTYTYRKAI